MIPGSLRSQNLLFNASISPFITLGLDDLNTVSSLVSSVVMELTFLKFAPSLNLERKKNDSVSDYILDI
jgi:hypothetical protein